MKNPGCHEILPKQLGFYVLGQIFFFLFLMNQLSFKEAVE